GQVALPGNGAGFSGFFWIPIVGPLIGGVVGVGVYEIFIKRVLVARGVVPAED
ncbi:MAG TPA: aquaporin, partial [Candidatus Dormibacteraeota bacterium]